jgi:hypothetical protein
VLHAHCGDCAGAVAERADLPGRVFVWRDSSAVGPCAVERERHRPLRAAWWGVPEAVIQDPSELPRDTDLVLWFGPDPWEQISLIEVLAGCSGARLSIAPLEIGVGLMSPEDLAPRFARRRDASDLPSMLVHCWGDFCRDDRPALRRWIDSLRSEPRLPHASAAILRVLEDRETGRTERRVRALVEAGVTALPELMSRLAREEAPGHGAWYGDAVVSRIVARVTGS